jgi:hypothetical protein
MKAADDAYGAEVCGEIRIKPHPAGRWPANVVLSHEDGCREVGTKRVRPSGGSISGSEPSNAATNIYGEFGRTPFPREAETLSAWECVPECAVRLLDEQSGERKTNPGTYRNKSAPSGYGGGWTGSQAGTVTSVGDTGGASRFFYCAKASPSERNRGMPEGTTNQHPTVKPLSIMSWLLTLVVPPGGTILDPFMGSGTTGCAAARLGIDFIGIDNDPESVRTAERRIAYWASPAARQTSPTRRAETPYRPACDTTDIAQLGFPVDSPIPDRASA